MLRFYGNLVVCGRQKGVTIFYLHPIVGAAINHLTNCTCIQNFKNKQKKTFLNLQQ